MCLYTMSLSMDMINMNESVEDSFIYDLDIVDESGFDDDYPIMEASEFGRIKMDHPSTHGFKAAANAMDKFVGATDPKHPDIDLALHDAFSKNPSGFDDDIYIEAPYVDPNTAPQIHAEEDQFEIPTDDIIDSNISDSELASDEDDIGFDESYNGYDDLF